MRGGDLRKPRRDLHVREAEEAAKRLAEFEKRGAESIARRQATNALIEQAVRSFFENVRPNSSILIDLLDRVRLVYRQIKDERGIDDEGWENPRWGEAGHNPISAFESQEWNRWKRGDGPAPFWAVEAPESDE